MRYFPLFLDLRGRRALIVGGGEQAAQKARLVLRTEARASVMAPELNGELAALVAEGRLRHVEAVYDQEEVDRAFVVFCASGCVGVDAWTSAWVQSREGVVNVVDKPRLCTAITPAIVDRDPLVVAIGTEGVAPVMAQRVKTLNESWLEPGLGGFLAEMARLRPVMAEADLAPSPREFWNWIMDGPRLRAASGDLPGAVAEVEEAVAVGRAPASGPGRLTLIELPAEGADMLPLRAVRRMQEADLLVHRPDAPPAALDYARRDAERLAAKGLPLEAMRAVLAGGGGVAALVPAAEGAEAAATLAAADMVCDRLAAPRALEGAAPGRA